TTQSSGCVRRAEPVTATEVCRGAVEWKQPLTHRDHGGSGPVPGRETETHRLVDSGSGVSGTARRVLQLGVVVAVSNTAHARVASRVSGGVTPGGLDPGWRGRGTLRGVECVPRAPVTT